MNLESFEGTPDSLKLRFKGFERKLSLGAPDVWHNIDEWLFCR